MVISVAAISEIAAGLRGMGECALADRLDYLASDEDLEPGECPATAESARGFFALFAAIESESPVGLGCSPEGWIVAEWRQFPDQRCVGIWFLDSDRVLFSGDDKDGELLIIEQRNQVAERSSVTRSLVEHGLFIWRTKE